MLLKLLEQAFELSHLSTNKPNATTSAADWMLTQVSNQQENWQSGHLTNQLAAFKS
jgi:hypothetical protein